MPLRNFDRHKLHCDRHYVGPCPICGRKQPPAAAGHEHCTLRVQFGPSAAAQAAGPCPFVAAGAEELARHQRVFHTPFPCAACGQGAFHPGQAFEDHLRDECGERTVHCPFASCGFTAMAAKLLEHHRDACGAKSENRSQCGRCRFCKGCGATWLTKDSKSCPRCHSLGEATVTYRIDFEAHKDGGCQGHFLNK